MNKNLFRPWFDPHLPYFLISMKFTPIRQFNEVKKFYCIGAITISYYKPIFLNQHASIILFKIHILRMPNVSFRDFLLPEKYSKILIFSCFKTQQRQWRHSGVFVNFKQISHIVLVFCCWLWTSKCRLRNVLFQFLFHLITGAYLRLCQKPMINLFAKNANDC